MSRFAPVSPELLAAELVRLFDARHPGDRVLRVGLDAPRCVDAASLIDRFGSALPALGRPFAAVDARSYYRDASLRLEYGREDVESFYGGWLDTAALQREVLTPVSATGSYLPSLRDPVSNRATRAEAEQLDPAGVLLVHGELLLGAGLGFDLVVHAAVSRQARRRQFAAEDAWQLPAFDRYDIEVDPAALADAVIRWDDPRRPALLLR